ncbi:unnamed protein product [Sphacelaria rigidula]
MRPSFAANIPSEFPGKSFRTRIHIAKLTEDHHKRIHRLNPGISPSKQKNKNPNRTHMPFRPSVDRRIAITLSLFAKNLTMPELCTMHCRHGHLSLDIPSTSMLLSSPCQRMKGPTTTHSPAISHLIACLPRYDPLPPPTISSAAPT